MKIIDIDKSPRKNQIEWFSSFSNPCCALSCRVDVTNVVKQSKMNKQSFFINFLYVVMEALHSVEEMRLRYMGDDIVLFDTADPSYTVMCDTGLFDTCKHKMSHDYSTFYSRASDVIEQTKHCKNPKTSLNDSSVVDVFYISCIPWIDFRNGFNPLPDLRDNYSIPRILWGKFVPVGDRYELTLDITVNHALVDGKPLADAFLGIDKMIGAIDIHSPKIKSWSEL